MHEFIWKAIKNGIVVAERHNIETINGQKRSVGARFGALDLPVYLGLDTGVGVITDVSTTSVTCSGSFGATNGDTLILSLGSQYQETTSAVTVSGDDYTWSTPTSLTHTIGDLVVRTPKNTDTDVITETEYAPISFPGIRQVMSSVTYADGLVTAFWTFNGAEAAFDFYGFGTFDSNTIGSGTMWNHCAMYVPHQDGTMLVIQVQEVYA